MSTRRVLIMGAAGRDFHNFNTVFRDDPATEVVAFTATQIPFINDRKYPASLAGASYPDGIQIYDESELVRLIRELDVDDVVFAYSDVAHEYVMHKASEVLAAGANFVLLGPDATMLEGHDPDGRGHRGAHGRRQEPDDPRDRRRAQGRRQDGRRGASPDAVRRPRRAARAALRGARGPRPVRLHDRGARGVRAAHHERHRDLRGGRLRRRSWSRRRPRPTCCCGTAGTTTCPFYTPDVWITLVDPLRAGHELTYHPGEANLRAADVIVVNKMDSATPRAGRPARRDDRRREPGGDGREGELARDGRRSRVDPRQARAGGRGRPDAHARLDEDRRGRGGRRAQRCRRDRRPASVGVRHDRRDVREVRRRRRAAGDGLQRRASSPRWRRSSTRPTSTSS